MTGDRDQRKTALRLPARLGVGTIDQSISSLSSFAVGIGAARVAGLRGFGAYSLVYAGWLILAACHRALITDPMAINDDVGGSDAAAHVRAGLAAELGLGLAAAVVFAAIGGLLVGLGEFDFGICFLGIAPWLPFLVAQDYWRWVSFMQSRPQVALVNDLVFDVVQLGAFVALYESGARSSLVAVTAWGSGAFIAGSFGMWQFSTRPTLRGALQRLQLRWSLSKWLLLVEAAGQATSQSTAVLTGVFLGPAGIGGLKAATTLISGPSLVLLQAGSSIGLPEAAKRLKSHGWLGLRRAERSITVAGVIGVGLVALTVFAFGRYLLTALYGPAFGRFAPTADILAVGYLIGSVSVGAALSLKATRQSRRIFHVSVISLVVSTVAVVVLAPLYGVNGAAVATVIGIVAMVAAMLTAHFRCSRGAAERMRVDSVVAIEPGPLPVIAVADWSESELEVKVVPAADFSPPVHG
jgi:O-antigen/teichoic acid export membrane protein